VLALLIDKWKIKEKAPSRFTGRGFFYLIK
jgi:hypothetical protein